MIWLLVIAAFGLNLTLWAAIGFLRLGSDSVASRRGRARHEVSDPSSRIELTDVAVLIPAHNESLVIDETIRAIAALVPITNVHVVSDGSKDDTVLRARRAGANVIDVFEPGGKARALKTGIAHFRLHERFKAVLLLDADTRLDAHYFEHALPLFDDPDVAAVAGYATTVWQPKEMSWRGQLLAAHRERIYVATQLFGKYGQTWRHTNVTPIVPGFASLYRSNVIDQIDIDAPGLVIEDFNMTFEVHHRKLGRVAFTPAARAFTQDPHKARDYWRQVRRWVLGFWQTVRRHRVWPGKFWTALSLTIFELVASSVILLLSAASLAVLLVGDIGGAAVTGVPVFGDAHDVVSDSMNYQTLAIGILLPDYVMTCVVAAIQRRPRYLLLGLVFVPLRLIDSAAVLVSLPKAWLTSSDGRWTSPERRASSAEDSASTAEAVSSAA